MTFRLILTIMSLLVGDFDRMETNKLVDVYGGKQDLCPC